MIKKPDFFRLNCGNNKIVAGIKICDGFVGHYNSKKNKIQISSYSPNSSDNICPLHSRNELVDSFNSNNIYNLPNAGSSFFKIDPFSDKEKIIYQIKNSSDSFKPKILLSEFHFIDDGLEGILKLRSKNIVTSTIRVDHLKFSGRQSVICDVNSCEISDLNKYFFQRSKNENLISR